MTTEGKSYLDQVLESSSLGFMRNSKGIESLHGGYPAQQQQPLSLPTSQPRRARAGTMPSMSLNSILTPPLLRTATHNHATATLLANVPPPSTSSTTAPSTQANPLLHHHHPPPAPSTRYGQGMMPVGGGRHRSGSLNLPPPSLSFDSNLFWNPTTNGMSPPSPATEQLLRGDDDYSIARTMRSLGLEDDPAILTTTPLNTQQQQPHHMPPQQIIDMDEEMINQSRANLLASASNTTTRNRSYSVNATVRYDPPVAAAPHFPLRSRANTVTKSSFGSNHLLLLDPFAFGPSPSTSTAMPSQQAPGTRSRSTSVGQSAHPMANGNGMPPIPPTNGLTSSSASSSSSSASSLWHMHRPLTPVIGEEDEPPYLSAGDSEFLANMEPVKQHDHLFVEPYMYLSHSTPTTMRAMGPNGQPSAMPPPMPAYVSRSLWIGNIDTSISVELLTQTFSPYGPIESVRLLMEKECAFVNYYQVDHAIRAKDDILGPLGGKVGHCIVRIGFGRAEPSPMPPTASVGAPNSITPPSLPASAAAKTNAAPIMPTTMQPVLMPSNSITTMNNTNHSSVMPNHQLAVTTPPLTTSTPASATNGTSNYTSLDQHLTQQATRALWLGNITPSVNSTVLQRLFASYGTIESVRILPHKSCAFINFDSIDSASAAQDAFVRLHANTPPFTNVRIGFAKVQPPSPLSQSITPLSTSNSSPLYGTSPKPGPLVTAPPAATATTTHLAPLKTSTSSSTPTSAGLVSHGSSARQEQLDAMWIRMDQLGCAPADVKILKDVGLVFDYMEAIPTVPEFSSPRKMDTSRLRDIRKKMDSLHPQQHTHHQVQCDKFAMECMDEIAEICSDYLGNTVMQRFFDKCSEDMKTTMLEKIAPHMAAIGVHKNGTWAAQKIIDTLKTPAQCELIRRHVKKYVPALMLDQFGNYVVQCCLKLGESDSQFLFDAMVDNCVKIAQSRFGARAMRGILENPYTTARQQAMVASCLVQHSVFLSTNANGTLLLGWLVDTYSAKSPSTPTSAKCPKTIMRLLASQLVPTLPSVALHKLGSQVILKLVNQSQDKEAQDIILSSLVTDTTLHSLLVPEAASPNASHPSAQQQQPAYGHRGVQFFQKVIYSTHLSQAEQQVLCARAQSILTGNPLVVDQPSPVHKAFLDELNLMVNA
ncbi:hypothetical protein DM01DRAFT_1334660 [Hesseltinella vesiculosa]|uniref:ARM repeat-containing protein n=1 Tax=Hesseltinella vesiculosa TaxID=101127 RepID=A0A1X2GKE9_9FUNG|nr:hypothetical protein DM01DRAFT_1334660 [Hesseltinella vesiculosa]